MEKKSLAKNAIYNLICNISSLIFPLITLPYVSRILGVENIGKYNFAHSIVSYFLLIAALGVSGYAIREGARIRENRPAASAFLSEMFSINIISTLLSFTALLILLVCYKKLTPYREIILVLGLIILFSPFAVTWVFTIFEDFAYISKRTILFQIISIILLFTLVKNKDDVIFYALVTVISNCGSNTLNYIYGKKYCDLKFTLKINWDKHFKPIMIIFVTSLAISIYVNSDMIVLGLLCSDYHVGLYSISVKIYTLLKNGLVSLLTVFQSRLAYYIGNNLIEDFNYLSNKLMNIIILFVSPIIVGVIILSREIILIISGEKFITASLSLSILCIAILFTLFGQFFNTCILMPCRKENEIFNISLISALINILLNLILIPYWKQNAAAFTTVIAEGVTFIIEIFLVKSIIKFDKEIIHTVISSMIGCLSIVLISQIIHRTVDNFILTVVLIISLSIISYFTTLFILKVKLVLEIISFMKIKFQTKKHNG